MPRRVESGELLLMREEKGEGRGKKREQLEILGKDILAVAYCHASLARKSKGGAATYVQIRFYRNGLERYPASGNTGFHHASPRFGLFTTRCGNVFTMHEMLKMRQPWEMKKRGHAKTTGPKKCGVDQDISVIMTRALSAALL